MFPQYENTWWRVMTSRIKVNLDWNAGLACLANNIPIQSQPPYLNSNRTRNDLKSQVTGILISKCF